MKRIIALLLIVCILSACAVTMVSAGCHRARSHSVCGRCGTYCNYAAADGVCGHYASGCRGAGGRRCGGGWRR